MELYVVSNKLHDVISTHKTMEEAKRAAIQYAAEHMEEGEIRITEYHSPYDIKGE